MANFEPKASGSLAWAVAIGLVIVTVLNGAGVYLKRTGLMETEAYRAYWSFHCRAYHPSGGMAAGLQCRDLAAPSEMEQQIVSAGLQSELALTRFGSRSSTAEFALKLLKDAFGLSLVAISLALLLRQAGPRPALQTAWPAGVLLAYAGVGLLTSLTLYEPLIALAGARSFLFMSLALLGCWLVPHMALLAAAVAALLAFQVILMPFELLRGLHLNGHFYSLPLAERLSGTLVFPNTLGGFAVCALAFYQAFAPVQRRLWLIALMALTLVFLGGSATGMVGFGLFLLLYLIQRSDAQRRRIFVIAGVLMLAGLVVLLPEITGRPQKFVSLWQRVDGLRAVFASKTFWEIWFGSGLGVDTNTARMLVRTWGAETFPVYARLASGVSDSMLTSLLTQLGITGILLFYGTLTWAAMRDRQARIFYAVLAVCSLTLQITEVFPVNFLLGVALAHSVMVAQGTAGRAAHV